MGSTIPKRNASAQDESNLRQIQAFFAQYALDYRVIACALMRFVPTRKSPLHSTVLETGRAVGQQFFHRPRFGIIERQCCEQAIAPVVVSRQISTGPTTLARIFFKKG